jgi:predicted ferric reductase
MLVATAISTSLLLLSYAGLYLAFRKHRILMAVAALCVIIAAAHAIGGTEARYTTPVRPVLYIFAALAVVTAWGRLERLLPRSPRSVSPGHEVLP